MAKKHFLPLFLIGLSWSAALHADEQTQSVQQALKDQGFYYGNVDGEGGAETDAAVRRFQIRNGLEVTGKLDASTIAALHLGGNSPGDSNTVEAVPPPGANGAPAQEEPATPPPRVVQSDRDFLRRHAVATPAPEAAAPSDSENAQPDQSPRPAAPEPLQASPAEYTGFFRRTPYEAAPLAVQQSTLRRAQIKLAREGMFRGVADGQPSEELSRALAIYQRDSDIAPSGRLDMRTLAQLGLLPQRRQVFRDPFPLSPYDEPPPPRTVYRGIWVH